jgi:hypothetical protein
MRRTVESPSGLRWTVRRLIVPNGLKPHTPTDMLDAATPRGMHVDGVPGSVRDAIYAPTGPMPLAFVFLPFALLLLPPVLLLRALRLLPWTVEARAYPWGRRYPPIVFSYEAVGRADIGRVMDEVVAALARGDGSPVVSPR